MAYLGTRASLGAIQAHGTDAAGERHALGLVEDTDT